MSIINGTCFYNRLIIESKTIGRESIDTVWKSNYNREYQSNIKDLVFQNCNFLEFPKFISNIDQNLNILEIVSCQLKYLNKECFIKYTELTELNIINCGLKILNGDLLENLTKIEKVSFANNKIEEIGPELLDNQNNLKYVDFRNNKNINMIFDAGKQESTNTLDEIKNEIKEKCKPNMQAIKRTRSSSISPMSSIIQNTMQQNMPYNLQKIFDDPAYKDFTINISESSFKVHKILFAARSPTLAEIFKNNPEAQELNLRDIPEETFKAIHDFIYNNHLPNDVNFIEVYAAAARLKIDDLMDTIVAHLLTNVDKKNAIDALTLSNKFNIDELRTKSFEAIQSKIFPERKLDEKLAREPEKLKEIIAAKNMLEQKFAEMMLKDEASGGQN
ncbi:hypothetical protein PVAND_001033 [Polypedilum vanderplanki]|uniref:BTB domain-containing protein n=1 Tax=Polypedilum vanderplanki TaxID=319348 RepID=A0A9J6BM03_POLVA|nr:hypothetical protein PVAND_001033 [Polypedilum vanderplanki]